MTLTLDFRRDTILNLTSDLLHSDPRFIQFNDIRKAPGQEHYFFLAALGLQLKNKKIIELGTHTGDSSYILAYANRAFNNNNTITTFDIQLKDRVLLDYTNVKYEIKDLFDNSVREQNRDFILSSDLIFIDIDPHEGILEYDMYLWLKSNEYKGIIIFDDIHLGVGHMGSKSESSMQQFWDKVEEKDKIDLTSVGHWSGTGLVCFYPENYTFLLD